MLLLSVVSLDRYEASRGEKRTAWGDLKWGGMVRSEEIAMTVGRRVVLVTAAAFCFRWQTRIQ